MKTITGTFLLSNGSPVSNGILYFELNQAAQATASGVQVIARTYPVTLDMFGHIPTTPSTMIWGNDELVPTGTFYRMTLTLAGGGRIYGPQTVTITGASPINLGTITPTI